MSWVEFSIDSIAEDVTKDTSPTTYGIPFTDEGVNFIKAEALNGDATLESNGFTFISEDIHERLRRSKLNVHDVLITIAGANVGKCGIVREQQMPSNSNQAVGIIRVDPQKASPRFIYYCFKNPRTFAGCQGIGGQAAQPNINLTVLKGFVSSGPKNPKEQERIEDLIAKYDDLIENNRRRIQLLEESARLLYKECTTLWVRRASPIFATFVLRAMKLEGYDGGAAVPNLNRNDVHKVDALCPEPILMNEFEVQVEDIFKQVDKLNV